MDIAVEEKDKLAALIRSRREFDHIEPEVFSAILDVVVDAWRIGWETGGAVARKATIDAFLGAL